MHTNEKLMASQLVVKLDYLRFVMFPMIIVLHVGHSESWSFYRWIQPTPAVLPHLHTTERTQRWGYWSNANIPAETKAPYGRSNKNLYNPVAPITGQGPEVRHTAGINFLARNQPLLLIKGSIQKMFAWIWGSVRQTDRWTDRQTDRQTVS